MLMFMAVVEAERAVVTAADRVRNWLIGISLSVFSRYFRSPS
jgi:hypothetical protein